jgi:hypothetical protein
MSLDKFVKITPRPVIPVPPEHPWNWAFNPAGGSCRHLNPIPPGVKVDLPADELPDTRWCAKTGTTVFRRQVCCVCNFHEI